MTCFAVDDLAWLKRFAIKHLEASERQGKHRHETPNSWLERQLPDASNWHHGTLVRVCPAWKSKAQATHDKVVSVSPDSSINRASFILSREPPLMWSVVSRSEFVSNVLTAVSSGYDATFTDR